MSQAAGIIKWPGEGGAARKTIYHSFLVREGRTMVKFKGDPRESKYAGKPPFVYLQVPDDPNEYALNLEPGTEDAVRNAPKNVWLYVKAIGAGRDDPKDLIIEDNAGPVFDTDEWEEVVPPPANGDARPMSGPPPMFPEDAKPTATRPSAFKPVTVPSTAERTLPNGMNPTMWSCWGNAVELVRSAYPEASADAAVEAASRIANTLYIAASK